MLSHYQQVLDKLREKSKKLASQYINELYIILKEEEHRSHEECRSKIESDCSDIWSIDTIRKFLPPEAKNETKRKAGKVSAEVKKLRKAKEMKVEEYAKPSIIDSGISGSGNSSGSGQMSVLIDGKGRDTSDGEDSDNSVGMNPTENGSVGQKKQESSTFQKVKNILESGNFRDEDFFSLPGVERLEEEALHEFEDGIPIEAGTRETIRALEKHVNDLEADFRIKCSQLDQLTKESTMWKKKYTQLQQTLDPYNNNNKIIKGSTQIEFGSEFLPAKVEYNYSTREFSVRIPEELIERLLKAMRFRK